MIPLLLLAAWFFAIVFICRMFHVCTTYDHPVIEEEEEEDEMEIEQCHRCGVENYPDDETESWRDEGYEHDEHDALFCESCFQDKDKYGQPYLTDLDDMRANPHDYLPYGY